MWQRRPAPVGIVYETGYASGVKTAPTTGLAYVRSTSAVRLPKPARPSQVRRREQLDAARRVVDHQRRKRAAAEAALTRAQAAVEALDAAS